MHEGSKNALMHKETWNAGSPLRSRGRHFLIVISSRRVEFAGILLKLN
jgi:hypothetical protein